MTVKLKVQVFKSFINFVWPSVERLEFTKLLAGALMNLNRWFRMKKAWAGKSLTSFVIFSQGLALVLVHSGLNQGAVLTAAKLLEAALEVAHMYQFAVAVPFSRGTVFISGNSTFIWQHRQGCRCCDGEGKPQNLETKVSKANMSLQKTWDHSSMTCEGFLRLILKTQCKSLWCSCKRGIG